MEVIIWDIFLHITYTISSSKLILFLRFLRAVNPLPVSPYLYQLYRCPDRYLFDERTSRCQREERATCSKFDLSVNAADLPAAAKNSVLVVLERYIDDFFSTPLTFKETRRKFS